MDFLSYREHSRLQKLLMTRTLLSTASVETRRSLLESCGLAEVCNKVPLTIPSVVEFVINLYPKLSSIYILVEETKE